MALGKYDKDNEVLYNPKGLYVKSFSEVARLFDAATPFEFILKGGFAFRLIIVTDGVEPPLVFLNGAPVWYHSGANPPEQIIIEFPRDATGAPRMDTIRIQRTGGGNDAQRVTLIYDKYVLP